MDTVMVSTVLVNILLGSFIVLILSWAVAGLHTIYYDYKRNKREQEAAKRDEEYHQKRMEELNK